MYSQNSSTDILLRGGLLKYFLMAVPIFKAVHLLSPVISLMSFEFKSNLD